MLQEVDAPSQAFPPEANENPEHSDAVLSRQTPDSHAVVSGTVSVVRNIRALLL